MFHCHSQWNIFWVTVARVTNLLCGKKSEPHSKRMPGHLPKISILAWVPCILILTVITSLRSEPTAEQVAFFENQVRPILANNCYSCHSLEKEKSKGGLTLDTHDGIVKGGETGPILIPGDPDHGTIITAIQYSDPDLQMPPKQRLSEQDILTLKQWIKMGAPDPQTGTSKLTGLTAKARSHWAYQPVTNPPVPTVKNPSWCQSPIDNFILTKLEKHDMTPSAPASRDVLIRRAYYDLVGLPPTPQQIVAFECDQNPGAFAKVVDQLLASPQYGERWGRHWLDTARYSDTIGGNPGDIPRDMDYRYQYAWSYRDYVINSFNQDKPYNQFIMEQLAADKLPEANRDKSILAGLGFLTVGARFRNPNDLINERIDVVSKGFLATTVTCARCHDHRFDPVPTTDYYALHGIFASSLEPMEKPIIKSIDPRLYSAFQEKMSALEQKNRDAYQTIVATVDAEFVSKAPLYWKFFMVHQNRLPPTEIANINQQMEQAGVNRDILEALQTAIQRKPDNDATFGPLKRLMNIPEAEFSTKAPGIISRLISNKDGNMIINPLVLAVLRDNPIQTRQDVLDVYGWLFTSAVPSGARFMIAAFSPSDSNSSVDPVMAANNSMMEMNTASIMGMDPNSSMDNIAQLAAATGADPNLIPFMNLPLPIELSSHLTTTKLRQLAQAIPNKLQAKSAKLNAQLDLNAVNELELTDPGSPERAMVMVDSPKPHDSPVLIRGQDQVRGPIVPRHFLTMLSPDGKNPPLFTEGSGRLELAEAIANKSNPLTARVMVNRVWMHHFGAGIVPTLDDLGNQSEPPSHPELLDYLATDFMNNGWSLKYLHRLIMLSSAYQESSAYNKSYQTIDPENRLLSHANIRRLDFESMRDSLLVFSGKMDTSLGGKPINLTDEPYSYRRSVYGYIDRGNLPELMSYFDFSDPDMPNSGRSSTIVPQQALFLMNSPMIVGVVRDMLSRPEVTEPSDDTQRIIALYRIIYQRPPQQKEIQLGLSYLGIDQGGQVLDSNQESTDSSSPVAAPVNKPHIPRNDHPNGFQPIHNQGEMVDRTPLTPWESYAQALLLANEMSYVD